MKVLLIVQALRNEIKRVLKKNKQIHSNLISKLDRLWMKRSRHRRYFWKQVVHESQLIKKLTEK